MKTSQHPIPCRILHTVQGNVHRSKLAPQTPWNFDLKPPAQTVIPVLIQTNNRLCLKTTLFIWCKLLARFCLLPYTSIKNGEDANFTLMLFFWEGGGGILFSCCTFFFFWCHMGGGGGGVRSVRKWDTKIQFLDLVHFIPQALTGPDLNPNFAPMNLPPWPPTSLS